MASFKLHATDVDTGRGTPTGEGVTVPLTGGQGDGPGTTGWSGTNPAGAVETLGDILAKAAAWGGSVQQPTYNVQPTSEGGSGISLGLVLVLVGGAALAWFIFRKKKGGPPDAK